MNMVYSSLFSPNFSIKPITKFPYLHPYLPSTSTIQYNNKKQKRDFPLLGVASIPYPPINVDYLESEFSGHGVTFGGIGDSCVVRMGLDNGSVATLMLPSGLITSYKAPMWHGGLLELLHTCVTEGEGGGAVIQGGVSLAFKCQSHGGVSWSPSNWALHDVTGNAQEFIQVELISRNHEDKFEVKHIVTLREDLINSEIVITNSKPSPLQIMGTIVSHLAVSTPEATYAVGLERSNFFTRPPVLSNFSIIPPNFSKNDDDLGSKKSWGLMPFKELLSGWGSRNENNADNTESENGEELEGEEDDNNKHLTQKMSRIYTNAPRNFTVIDRGRRNSVIVGREGFEEVYMFSPGSTHKWYGKYAYICIGQSALLEPIILAPRTEWRGGQLLHNPNL